MATEVKTTEIRESDVVRVKSGSLPMTVASITEGRAHCVWVDSDNNPRDEKFPIAVLVKEEE